MTLITQFGQRIRELRLAQGISQEQLAEKTGFHRSYIGMIEIMVSELRLTIFARYYGT